jgi:superfamily II DNA or RNA helicase
VVAAFEALWTDATPLTDAWLADYTDRARSHERPLLLGDSDDLVPDVPPQPLGVQPAALQALHDSRTEGRCKALVVLATGLGKTFLAAFDAQALGEELGRVPRVLFVAHRRELLVQAARTFRQVFPDASIGFVVGASGAGSAQLVFASVQKLSQPDRLQQLDPHAFDYVVVDETHHAPADSYRKVLRRLQPRFLLGLTATPERADQADVAGLFDDHVAFRADLGEGIELGRLVPFDYAGLPDDIVFEALPWRHYTAARLTKLAQTEERMKRLLAAWETYPGTRTLVFCITIDHAEYVTAWLRQRGVRIVACHSGEDSADRDTALEQLAAGQLDAVAAVDLFNEGIDVPSVDRVVMLRPTASPVVFLQQLGRGLRVSDGKERLQVIDFIGNHKVFLHKVRMLLSLAPGSTSTGQFFRDAPAELQLRGLHDERRPGRHRHAPPLPAVGVHPRDGAGVPAAGWGARAAPDRRGAGASRAEPPLGEGRQLVRLRARRGPPVGRGGRRAGGRSPVDAAPRGHQHDQVVQDRAARRAARPRRAVRRHAPGRAGRALPPRPASRPVAAG